MIQKQHLPKTLCANTTTELLDIVVQFTNAFIELYGQIIDETAVLKKLENLHCICFENSPNNTIKLGENCNASWNPDLHQITINPKFIKRNDELKMLVYHELNHVLTERTQTQEKQNENQIDIKKNIQQDLQARENVFDEIMTEYYATKIFEITEGKGFKLNKMTADNTYTIKKNDHEFLVKYDGMAYEEYGQLGGMYDFLFGEKLLRARLGTQKDEEEFINDFNKYFASTSLGKNTTFISNNPYDNFCYEKDPLKRCDSSLEIFDRILKRNGLKKILRNTELEEKRDLVRKVSHYLPIDKANTYEDKIKDTIENYNKNTTKTQSNTYEYRNT